MSKFKYILHVITGHRWVKIWSVGYSCRAIEVSYLCETCGKQKTETYG